jgi:CHAT domain-containing protein
VAGLSGRQIVHIAAHGFADLKFDNQFGALAVTPPPHEMPRADDGFLYVHEISRLPLQACELAVLSACDTNVGNDQPLEAGVTLGNAFLVAGARRVVASHWPVEDQATAELMDVFFKELASPKSGDRNPARALHAARKHMHRKLGHPFYWGAFTLSGQVD